MPPVPQPRPGASLTVSGRPVRFSLWPTTKSGKRHAVQSHVYASSPWALIYDSVRARCPKGSQAEALALLDQGRYFFQASTLSEEWAAKPLPLYYSFLNLAKAFILTRAIRSDLTRSHHGIKERLKPNGKELVDAYLEVDQHSSTGSAPVFAEFWNALSGHKQVPGIHLDLTVLLPQVIAGHRLWCTAAKQSERFVNVEAVDLLQDVPTKSMWAVIKVHSGTLSPLGISHKDMLAAARLSAGFREVEGYEDGSNYMVQFEHKAPLAYSHRPSDKLTELIESFRHSLWMTAMTVYPYRSYYLYVPPSAERQYTLPQLLAVYAICFYLGSITRYRPHHFAGILGSTYGAYIHEFLTLQPTQFLYLLASEFAQREVAKAELV